MKVLSNEILFIYNPSELLDRQTFGYAQSLSNYSIKEFDIRNHKMTGTQLEQLATLLSVHPSQLIDETKDIYRQEYGDTLLERSGVLKVLQRNLTLIKTPIMVFSDHAKFIKSSFELMNSNFANENKKTR